MIGDVTGTRAVIATVVSLSVLSLGGCSGDDPEPRIAPPGSSAPTSPSTTPASGPTEPVMPDEARGTDARAAAAFVKFYFEAVNYAQETGDVAALKRLSVKCAGCDAGVRSITDTYHNNGEIRGGTGSVHELQTGFIHRKPTDWAVVQCSVFTSPQIVDLPGTHDDRRYPRGHTDVRLLLEPHEGAWVIRSLVTT
jgi:hypothetical protein